MARAWRCRRRSRRRGGRLGGGAGRRRSGRCRGAVVGGLAARPPAKRSNPTAEEAFWRDNYDKEPYYEQGRSFDDYAPAYRLGLSGRQRYEQDRWTSVEPRLASEWDGTAATPR